MEGKGACALKITSTGLFEGRAEGELCAWMIVVGEKENGGKKEKERERVGGMEGEWLCVIKGKI